MKKPEITGIILCGGRSLRMGKEKGLVELAGKPLIEHAVEILQPLADDLYISSNSSSFGYLGIPVIKDIHPDSGPMGGIYSCLKESPNQKNLVLSCDTPFVSRAMLEEILAYVPPYQLVAPWYGKEYFEPLCAFYSRDLLPVFEGFIARKNYKLPDLYQVVHFKAYDLNKSTAYYEDMFLNINTQDDLDKANAHITLTGK